MKGLRAFDASGLPLHPRRRDRRLKRAGLAPIHARLHVRDQAHGGPNPRKYRRFPTRDFDAAETRSVAEDAVGFEPVCGSNSLITGKLTGNFANFDRLRAGRASDYL